MKLNKEMNERSEEVKLISTSSSRDILWLKKKSTSF